MTLKKCSFHTMTMETFIRKLLSLLKDSDLMIGYFSHEKKGNLTITTIMRGSSIMWATKELSGIKICITKITTITTRSNNKLQQSNNSKNQCKKMTMKLI